MASNGHPQASFPEHGPICVGDFVQHSNTRQWGEVLEVVPQRDGTSELHILVGQLPHRRHPNRRRVPPAGAHVSRPNPITGFYYCPTHEHEQTVPCPECPPEEVRPTTGGVPPC